MSAVVFDKGEGLFYHFIKEMYKRKADARERGDGVEELLYKLLQNSLFGKAGQKEIIHSFKLIANDKVKSFELKNKTDLSHEFGNKTLIRTQGKIEGELEGIISKVMGGEGDLYDEEDDKDSKESRDLPMPPRKKSGVRSSVSIAAAITAYARINMNKYKNIKGNKYLGGDTDSAIMEKELSKELVGKGLGMMKEECRINIGLFGDKKLYLIQDMNGQTIIKSRGVGKDIESGDDILSYNDFLKLFKGEVLNIIKHKFTVREDGIYFLPHTIAVRLSEDRLLKIKEELKDILDNVKHPLH